MSNSRTLPVTRCHYIKPDGLPCGSPALKNHRKRSNYLNANRARRSRFLPGLSQLRDGCSVLGAISQTRSLILARRIDHKTAGLLLNDLQKASEKLGAPNPERPLNTAIFDEVMPDITGLLK